MRRSLLLASAAIVLAGCNSEPLSRARGVMDAQPQRVAEASARLPEGNRDGTVISGPSLWLGDQTIPLLETDDLPRTKPVNLTFRDPQPLSTIVAALEAQAEYPIAILDADYASRVVRFDYNGNLQGALELLSSRASIRYQVIGGRIVLVSPNVELVNVPLLFQAQLQPVSFSGTGGLPAFQSNASNRSPYGSASTPEEEGLLMSQLKDIATAVPYPGVTITPYPALGLIAIRAPNGAAVPVRRIVEERVRLFRAQTRIVITLLAIDTTENRQLETNFDGAISSLLNNQPGRFSFDTTNGGGIRVLRALPTGVPTNSIDTFINTLASRVSVVDNRRFDQVVRAGVPTPIGDGTQITYLRSLAPPSATASGIVNTAPTATQETLDLGLVGTVAATPVSSSRVVLGFAIENKSLISLNPTEIGGGFRVQSPSNSVQRFACKVELLSGYTQLCLQRTVVTTNESGAGLFAADVPLPGRRDGRLQRRLVLALVSAEILPDTPPRQIPDNDQENPLNLVSKR